MMLKEKQDYFLEFMKKELDNRNFKTDIVKMDKPCIQIGIKGTYKLNSKSRKLPALHYEFLFDEKTNLKLYLEIHCEKDNVKKEFWGDKIKSSTDPNEKDYKWLDIKKKKIIRYKKTIDLQGLNDEKTKELVFNYLKMIRDKFESELIDLYNSNKIHFDK